MPEIDLVEEFKEICKKEGGEFKKNDELNYVECSFYGDYYEFIEVSEWMKKNVMPKRDKLRNEFYSEYHSDAYPPSHATFGIGKNFSYLRVSTEDYISSEGMLSYLEESIREDKGNISEDKLANLIDKRINDWIRKFPIKKDDLEIDVSFDGIYDSWVISAEKLFDVKDTDDIDKLLEIGFKKTEIEVQDIEYP